MPWLNTQNLYLHVTYKQKNCCVFFFSKSDYNFATDCKRLLDVEGATWGERLVWKMEDERDWNYDSEYMNMWLQSLRDWVDCAAHIYEAEG